MKKYEGPLNINKMNPIEKRAYKSWKDQGQRCQNPNDKGYKFWGAKGIKRVYGPREFIAWYVENYSKRDSWKRAHVDRIDSEGNYDFSNIQLLEMSENTKKRNDLYGNPCESSGVICIYPNGETLRIPSIREAERLTGIGRKYIQKMVRGEMEKHKKTGISFNLDQ